MAARDKLTARCGSLGAELSSVRDNSFSLPEGTMAESSTNSFGSPLPVFRVKDVDASVAYYLDSLGFKLRWRAGDGFACVAREECSIFLPMTTRASRVCGYGSACRMCTDCIGTTRRPAPKSGTCPKTSSGPWRCRSKTSTETSSRIGSDPEKDKPLGVWRDGDGIRWRHLGNQWYERVE